MREAIATYLSTVQTALGNTNVEAVEQVVHALFDAYLKGQTIFTMGNGANAALAAHMACDLGKGTAPDLGKSPREVGQRRLRVICLNDNIALLTAYSNDLAYEDVFVEQLKNLLMPRDVVIGVSRSGGSPNVLRAMHYARDQGALTIGFTGAQPSARKMRECADLLVDTPLALMEQIEDAHVVLHHVISVSLREMIAADAATSQPFVPRLVQQASSVQ